ncbi:protein of unknown function (DUF1790) [Bernardetia litoralis DSM 6794]|uniref:Bacterial sensory transduction regulator n=1 Tax=Bernardetia litoralis (strain ATCC 23117 / DSM 6794 / NBRC 15988 / NCIMB 1366 / Fx l1 / Sio-4) TaxID=880071 RepID=I4AQ56_BERLS|nr:hypothetical protein [Bernardetia litoralis]AFM06091.1 protein of unknown function (DUF1790) [Bernardetia litoralis DSM 6794]
MQKSDPTKSYEVVKQISSLLQMNGFATELHEFMPNCWFNYTYNSTNYTCYVAVDSIKYIITYYFVPAIKIPEELLMFANEFAELASSKTSSSKFEIDDSIREISYTIVRDWKEAVPQMSSIMDDIETGMSMWGMYLSSITSVLFDGKTPKEALSWR